MKKIILLSFLCLSAVGFSQDQKNPGAYLDYFAESYNKMTEDMWEYTKSVSHGRNARKIEKTRATLIKSSTAALNRAKVAKGFEGDTDYRDAVIEYFELINIVLKEDYAKIVDMEAVAEQSYDDMEAYMMAREMASEKQSQASEALERAQKQFAATHNVELIDRNSSMEEKMRIAGEVFEHYNDVYLAFFKCNKQEGYLLEAISSGDLSAIEQNREALKSTIEEGMNMLGDVKMYKNDGSMIEATKAIFQFYEKEYDDVKLAIDYFLKTEKFNKIKSEFDQIKEKDRTQSDVDNYNNAVNEMNEAIKVYNEANDANNKERAKLVDGWNATAEKFTSKHVPKGN